MQYSIDYFINSIFKYTRIEEEKVWVDRIYDLVMNLNAEWIVFLFR
jgi:hypothetical protein